MKIIRSHHGLPKRFSKWCKILLIMRISFFLFFVGIINLIAGPTYSQNTKISLSMKDATLESVLNEIEGVSEFYFLYNSRLIDIHQKVDVSAEEELIKDILNDILPDNIKYVVSDRQIVLTPAEAAKNLRRDLQQITVSGKVTDASTGNPMPGVNVQVKETTFGAITDIGGNYSLVAPGGNVVLIFSFIGYDTYEVPVEGRTIVNVTLSETTTALDEVVVIGYGTQKKSDLTGSVARVSMDNKTALSSFNITQAIAGSVAGMNVPGASGEAGSDLDISIRGRTSLSASDAPLIVVDGIIFNGSLSNINSSDVETIDILKDASSAAVFGSRSANGVILITTKKGRTQKPSISFSSYFGYQDMVNNPVRVMDGEQYAIRIVDFYYQQDLYAWYASNPSSDAGRPVYPDISDRNYVASVLRYQEEIDNYKAGPENEIDWVREVTQLAPIQNYNLNISGIGNNVNYFISSSYTNEKGIQINDKFDRFTFRANLESDITKWMKIGFNSSFSFRDYSGLPASLSNAITATPWANNHIGSPIYDIDLCQEQYMHYPFDETYVTDIDTKNNQVLVGRSIITVPWVKGLTYEFNYSSTIDLGIKNTFAPVTTRNGEANKGMASKNSTTENNWLLNNIITYNRTFSNDHRLNVTLLYSRENRNYNSTTAEATQFDNDVLGFNNLSLGVIPKTFSSAWEENSISYMSRLNYVYKDRYMFTGTVRRDGYSGFGAGTKFAVFPSFSFAWVTSDEPFFKDRISWLYLKERISWGKNGNQGIGRYSSLSKMGVTNYVYDSSSTVAIYPLTLGNSSLKWESTASLNFGLDWGLFNRRISGSFDFYTAKTSDLLVQRSIPTTTGYSSVWSNLGQIANKGFEMEVVTKNLSGMLDWETNFTFAMNKDKIVDLYGDKTTNDIGNSWFIGEPISAIYDYEMIDGTVWSEADLFSGNILDGWYPGQFKLVDQNNDGQIEPNADRKIVGYEDPLFRFSINNTFSYKNFALSFFINSIQGGKEHYLYENSYFLLMPVVGTGDPYRRNQFAIRKYWTPDNGVTNAVGMYNNPPRTAGLYQSRSFVRLQDVSISYTFNEKFLKKLKLSSCQLYVSSKNPYIWTNWGGWDPEITLRSMSSMRNITLGLKVTL